MSNVLFILFALAVAAVVVIGLWWRDRRPPSIEEGIDAFHRELEALAPESHHQPVNPVQQQMPPPPSPSPSRLPRPSPSPSEEGRPG